MVSLKSDDDGEPLKQDKIEGDFMQAAASLQNLLELVEVANSYVQLNKTRSDQHYNEQYYDDTFSIS